MSDSNYMLGLAVQKLVVVPPHMLGTVYDLLERLASRRRSEVLLKEVKLLLRRKTPEVMFRTIKTVVAKGAQAFEVGSHFRVGIVDGVAIAEVTPRFTHLFSGFAEVNISPGEIKVHVSLQPDHLSERFLHLDFKDCLPVSFCDVWQLLKQQPTGQSEGVLPVDGSAAIFLIGGQLSMVISWDKQRNGWVINSIAEPNNPYPRFAYGLFERTRIITR